MRSKESRQIRRWAGTCILAQFFGIHLGMHALQEQLQHNLHCFTAASDASLQPHLPTNKESTREQSKISAIAGNTQTFVATSKFRGTHSKVESKCIDHEAKYHDDVRPY
jgi:hypothetical protein